MSEFQLQPADILVNLSTGKNPFAIMKRWFLGSPFEHVFMYMGRLGLIRDGYSSEMWNVPMLFESYGRGVCLRSLSERYSQEVVVLRL
ncbi:unnamed protein product, partial [marine sediment metagenome]